MRIYFFARTCECRRGFSFPLFFPLFVTLALSSSARAEQCNPCVLENCSSVHLWGVLKLKQSVPYFVFLAFGKNRASSVTGSGLLFVSAIPLFFCYPLIAFHLGYLLAVFNSCPLPVQSPFILGAGDESKSNRKRKKYLS